MPKNRIVTTSASRKRRVIVGNNPDDKRQSNPDKPSTTLAYKHPSDGNEARSKLWLPLIKTRLPLAITKKYAMEATSRLREKSHRPLAGNSLDLDSLWGLAAHADLDFVINKNQCLRVDAHKIDIDSYVKLNGADVGTVNIDPTIYGIAYVRAF